jgi:hypothetical protein
MAIVVAISIVDAVEVASQEVARALALVAGNTVKEALASVHAAVKLLTIVALTIPACVVDKLVGS